MRKIIHFISLFIITTILVNLLLPIPQAFAAFTVIPTSTTSATMTDIQNCDITSQGNTYIYDYTTRTHIYFETCANYTLTWSIPIAAGDQVVFDIDGNNYNAFYYNPYYPPFGTATPFPTGYPTGVRPTYIATYDGNVTISLNNYPWDDTAFCSWADGRVVSTQNAHVTACNYNSVTLSSPLPAGTYFLEVKMDNVYYDSYFFTYPTPSPTLTPTPTSTPTPLPTATPTLIPNAAPVLNSIANATVNAGTAYTASGSFSDPDSSSWTATVDYGDGSGVQPLNLTGTNFSLNHIYGTHGTYTVTVHITDNQGLTGSTTTSIVVNALPVVSGLSDTSVNFQDDMVEIGSFTDADSTSWTATVDYGDGFGVQPLTLNTDHTFTLDRAYPAIGIYTATVTITDNQGGMGISGFTVIVNAPPHINLLNGATITEGQTYSETGSFIDDDSTSWTAIVDYGDGSPVAPLSLNADKTFVLNHAYIDNGTYQVLVKITDNQGAMGIASTTITVNNVAPTVGIINASVNPVLVSNPTTLSTTFTDSGVLDTHTAVWNWGDGNTSNATIIENNGSGSVADTHTYTSTGVYPVTLTVTDNNGTSTTQTFQYISVYAPTNQGLLSAGSNYTSPQGALILDPTATGKVKFGLSYKYQGTMPTGIREFSMDYNQANFHFNATLVSSLVISNGIGNLVGTGTLNGSGTYNFLVTGSENTNTIRIKITDASNTIVYDTQPGAEDTATPTTTVTGHVLAH